MRTEHFHFRAKSTGCFETEFTKADYLAGVASGHDPLLAAAWQASTAGCEGDAAQHVRFATSHDGGDTWYA